jgi:elongator complex protein 4
MLLIEENGTTDFAGALLRYYAAEGVVQDQKIHVIGMPEQWGRSLPGLIGPADATDDKADKRKGERMKIAWRYERLGEFGAGVAGSRGKPISTVNSGQRSQIQCPLQTQETKARVRGTEVKRNSPHFAMRLTSPSVSPIRP